MSKNIQHLLDDKFIDMWREGNFPKTVGRWTEYVVSLGMEFREPSSRQPGDGQQNVYATDPATMRTANLRHVGLKAENGKGKTPLDIVIPRELAFKILALGHLP